MNAHLFRQKENSNQIRDHRLQHQCSQTNLVVIQAAKNIVTMLITGGSILKHRKYITDHINAQAHDITQKFSAKQCKSKHFLQT